MRSPNETGDSFAAITEKITVLGHSITELSTELSTWTDHGLRCESVEGSADPDALAAAHAQSARFYLTDPAVQR
ncbi:hypothetical protein [Rhodococcus sp. H29-C3]|uniref:hypothetical protein n=1 Tax=Rhodococcus sp. H29-C3 TaxID=3046307 RepID=UPI0024B94130|nr:hypothetical protein [Rhodococcus sp. H29-C3]MDJ0363135.1 hypothetical protein [Rhodococcus sp. H29-C3]